MTLSEFDNVIELVISFLEQDCIINPESYRKSGEDFEPCVKRAVDFALEELYQGRIPHGDDNEK